MRVKVHENWTECARLWTALIGDVSAKKSPVQRTAMAPLKQLDKQNYAQWAEAHSVWEEAPKDDRGPEPKLRRHILNDTTIEAAARAPGNGAPRPRR